MTTPPRIGKKTANNFVDSEKVAIFADAQGDRNLVHTERKNIADENQNFTNYVQGSFVDDFWWK